MTTDSRVDQLMRPQGHAPAIERASGCHVWTTDRRPLVDLANGFGAVFMGHGHPSIVARVHAQIDAIWATGRGTPSARVRADAAVRRILPDGMVPAGFYSTGMEVVEYAMRLAAVLTGRNRFVGFERSMHGKSALTASLCWSNAPIALGDRCVRLPFLPEAGEESLLAALADVLRSQTAAAVLVEPVQASNGGCEARPGFLERVMRLCRASGTLCIVDEIMTGLWRTGPRFYTDDLDDRPDVLLFGKSMANGLPVSALAVRRGLELPAAALPGSTFAGNPVAMAATEATLEAMGETPMRTRVEGIEACVRSVFARRSARWALRGQGALWFLDVGADVGTTRVLDRVLERGVLASGHGRFVRLLPAATIDLAVLGDACRRVAEACEADR